MFLNVFPFSCKSVCRHALIGDKNEGRCRRRVYQKSHVCVIYFGIFWNSMFDFTGFEFARVHGIGTAVGLLLSGLLYNVARWKVERRQTLARVCCVHSLVLQSSPEGMAPTHGSSQFLYALTCSYILHHLYSFIIISFSSFYMLRKWDCVSTH